MSGWCTAATAALIKASSGELEKVWLEQLDTLVTLLKSSDPGFAQLAVDYSAALSVYAFEQDSLLSLAEKPVLSLKYNDNRPAGQESDSTFRLIYDQGFGKNWSLTANFAVDFYDTQPTTPTIGRLRDLQFGAELDRKLPNIPILGSSALSWAYYYQNQKNPILAVDASQPLPGITFVGLPSGANQVLAQTGNIHIAQMKMTMGGGSSIRYPLAVTWSNRTELIDKPEWRAQVGVSYSFDALFAK